MRPDQHKRKKNAEYKKKHGFSSEQQGKHEKAQRKVPNECLGATAVCDDSNEVDDTTVRNEFSRRTIQSNSDRYTEDNTDEELYDSRTSNTFIGDDFETLLNNATSIGSHFQFQNEKDWDKMDRHESNKANNSFLIVDCHTLAQSLKTIDVGERLEINKKYTSILKTGHDYSPYGATTIQSKATSNLDVNTTDERDGQKKHLDINESSSTIICESLLMVNETRKSSSFSHKNTLANVNPSQEQYLDHLERTSKERVEIKLDPTSGHCDNLDIISGKNRDKEPNVQPLVNMDKDVGTNHSLDTPINTSENIEDWLDSILD